MFYFNLSTVYLIVKTFPPPVLERAHGFKTADKAKRGEIKRIFIKTLQQPGGLTHAPVFALLHSNKK